MNGQVFTLFPELLYLNEVDLKDLTFNEEDFKFVSNKFNSTTESTDILLDEKYNDLKAQLQWHVDFYFYNVLKVVPATKIFITESWINKTVKNEFHHLHRHGNSIVSGIVYLNDAHPSGVTKFSSGKYSTLSFEYTEHNQFNAIQFGVSPKKGRLVLFPSSLHHETDLYKGDESRLTLSFNTFVQGKINQTNTQYLVL